MKYFSFIIYAALICTSILARGETRDITMEFSLDDFSVEANKGTGIYEIMPATSGYTFANTDEPGLPLKHITVAIPQGLEVQSVDCKYNEKVIFNGYKLAPNPLPVEVGDSVEPQPILSVHYKPQIFPKQRCLLRGTSKVGNLTLVYLTISPFQYDVSRSELSFADHMTVRLILQKEEGKSEIKPVPESYSMFDALLVNRILSTVVDTKSEELLLEQSKKSPGYHKSRELEDMIGKIDYVIITSQELKPAFRELAQWKTEKGVPTEIVAVEDIYAVYQAKDEQLKIKDFLQDVYYHHQRGNSGVLFVTLGGDDSIVPTRGCYGKVLTANEMVIDQNIPTDLYYACFKGNFEWDANNNGIYGEVDDEIDLIPDIVVTRIPVNSELVIKNYTAKLIEYERSPQYGHNLLATGVDRDTHRWFVDDRFQSRAEICGNILFNTTDINFWDIQKMKFYDTYSDFKDRDNSKVSALNLMKRIEEGFSFINVLAAGNQKNWFLEGSSQYSIINAGIQEGGCHSFITSAASFTNAFDSPKREGFSDPCISEMFIRLKNNNVLGLYGSSRQSWLYNEFSLKEVGPTTAYIQTFYNNLLGWSDMTDKFGIISAFTNLYLHSEASGEDGPYRWLQYSMNSMGDAEMPVYTQPPLIITDLGIFINKEGGIQFESVNDYNYTFMKGEFDNPNYYQSSLNSKGYIMTNLYDKTNLCLTQLGYVPRYFKINLIQNQNFSGKIDYQGDLILIGSFLTSASSTGPVSFKEGTIKVTGSEVIIGGDTEICLGSEVNITTNN